MEVKPIKRRIFLGSLASLSATALSGLSSAAPLQNQAARNSRIYRPIPSSKELLPVIGMGTWITFNVGNNLALRNKRTEVLQEFFKLDGGMIDCSPMYGSSAAVLGYGLKQIKDTSTLFSASKVWTSWTNTGPNQMEEQRQHWGLKKFDLMQIHNLVNWERHLETLQDYKASGKIRYIGVTTSHGRRHQDLEVMLRKHTIDFVQLTYNILDRDAETKLLPLAQERGVAVIANRPYQGGELFRRFQSRALPSWTKEEVGASTWAEFFLKYIVSHPAVTCAIPATSQLVHIRENMNAGLGRLPDESTRTKMVNFIRT